MSLDHFGLGAEFVGCEIRFIIICHIERSEISPERICNKDSLLFAVPQFKMTNSHFLALLSGAKYLYCKSHKRYFATLNMTGIYKTYNKNS